MPSSSPDVYTLDELVRAVGVPRRAAHVLLDSGGLRPIEGSRFFTANAVMAAADSLRAAAVVTGPLSVPRGIFAARPGSARNTASMLASSCVQGALLVAVLWFAAGSSTPRASTPPPPEPARMVFLISPGPGGGGGGSGARQRPRPTALERAGQTARRASVPKVTPKPALSSVRNEQPPAPAPPAPAEPVAKPPEPLAARTVVAPVVVTAAATREREGVVETPAPAPSSQGSGTGGNAGTGRGEGVGEGTGSGIGDGAGGGTGGGPYRPGSGIQPPRLLREVKAEYTEDARRRGITGEVTLEIVVRRDGTVGDVTVRRGLGNGLDERAVAAVRQWQFAPARRLGAPVDVIVEVSVQFALR